MPYERTVASDRPAASRSRKKAVTGGDTDPSSLITRNGSYGFPVFTSAPACGTTSAGRSRSGSSIMSGDRTAQDPRQRP